ncbi:MAG TPA: metalloregulator ArsR/SmtB family transcription factor [Gammaproteobacteria bacterium]|nr:metalloregulator ArsR/SmtB family transcription factor [Gammaproteobacteria bacterium]
MSSLDNASQLCRLLGDPTRLRLIRLLELEELTVAELTGITELAQSRVSTHLGKLRDAGLVRDRRAGTSTYYRLNLNGGNASVEHFWERLRQDLDDPTLEDDSQRLQTVLAERHGDVRWADSVAGRMDRQYSPGRTWEALARALIGLVELGDTLDVASGDGLLAQLLAPRARSYACVDLSPRVVAAGRRRLRTQDNVTLGVADMHALPFPAACFDQVFLMHALTYSHDAGRVIAEAARVLRPGGRLTGATLKAHAHESQAEAYDHVNLGFEPEDLRELLVGGGFAVDLCRTTSRERRAPHFEVVTFQARRTHA